MSDTPLTFWIDKPSDRNEEAPYEFYAYSTEVFETPGVCVEAGSDSSPQEALDRLYDALEGRGLLESREVVRVIDPESLLEAYPPENTA